MRKWSCKLQNKLEIRKALLKKREAISFLERKEAAEKAALHFQNAPFFSLRNFACYFAQPNEFDCTPLIESIWSANKLCYLPVLAQDKTLTFVHYRKADSLKLNRFQIYEPVKTETVSLETLDVILMPLVGFDMRGNRLGMGGGYYDRTFEKIAKLSNKPYFLGVAFEAQKWVALPHDPWDIQLDGVLTEKRWYSFK